MVLSSRSQKSVELVMPHIYMYIYVCSYDPYIHLYATHIHTNDPRPCKIDDKHIHFSYLATDISKRICSGNALGEEA